MNKYYKLQSKYKKIIFNVLILIFIYFFSFNIFPNLMSSDQYNYKKISIHEKNINAVSTLIESSEPFKNKEFYWVRDKSSNYNQFLNEFIEDLSKDPILLKNIHCPSEVLKNNMRNIYIYFERNNKNIFNVRFYVNRIFNSRLDETNIDKCFNFIFVENLNKFYYKKFEEFINKLEYLYESSNLEKEKFNNINILELTYSDFIKKIKEKNINLVKLKNFSKIEEGLHNYIEGKLKNGQSFRTTQYKVEDKYMDLLLSDNTTIIIDNNTIEDRINYFNFNLNEIIKHLKKIHEKSDNFYFVDPNTNYRHTEIVKDMTLQKYWSFIILCAIVIIGQIIYNKLPKK
jgi:hypothetical protein